jgi:hypothetical protein
MKLLEVSFCFLRSSETMCGRGPQVSKLLDSLYHEYPAGQILLWDTAELAIVTKNLEGVETPTLSNADRPKIVLDGQQRLTSLFKALREEEGDVVIYFNRIAGDLTGARPRPSGALVEHDQRSARGSACIVCSMISTVTPPARTPQPSALRHSP